MKEISRTLYSRSMHRMFGSPTIGNITAFLTMIFIIRLSVNLYFINIFNDGNTDINFSQVISGWFLSVSAYIIFCSSLSAFHISFAIPKNSFAGISCKGRGYKSSFLKYAALIRPMNIVMLVISVIGIFIFRTTSDSLFLSLLGIPIIAASIGLSFIIFLAAEKLDIGMMEVQITEAVLLGILVTLNPDIIQTGGTINLVVYGLSIPFNSPVVAALSILIFFTAACLLLSAAKIITALNTMSAKHRVRLEPFTSWYLHFFKPTNWILLYIFIIPVLRFNFVSFSMKQKVTAGYLIFCLVSLLIFLMHCENTIQLKFRRSLFTAKHFFLALKPLMLHLFFSVFPLIFLLFK